MTQVVAGIRDHRQMCHLAEFGSCRVEVDLVDLLHPSKSSARRTPSLRVSSFYLDGLLDAYASRPRSLREGAKCKSRVSGLTYDDAHAWLRQTAKWTKV